MDTQRFRQYEFVGSFLRIYPNGACVEFPKWCLAIHCQRSRADVAALLRLARSYRRTREADRPHEVARIEVGQYKAEQAPAAALLRAPR